MIRRPALPLDYRGHVPAEGFDASLRRFAEAALWLQQQRHSADYDPIPRFRTADALTAIEQARTALSHFHTAPAKQRHALLWLLLFRPR